MLRKSIYVILSLLFLCNSATAADKKMRVAVIDFSGNTPNEIPIREIMDIINDSISSMDIFQLVPKETVEKSLGSNLGFDAKARNFDPFSAARLGKTLNADAFLMGEVNLFEKNPINKGTVIKIDGVDISERGADVALKAKLIDARSGAVLAEAGGSGRANDSVINDVTAFIEGSLTHAYIAATRTAAVQIAKGLQESLEVPSTRVSGLPELTRYTILKVDGNSIYINAGFERVSIGDIFEVVSSKGNGEVLAAAKLVEASSNGSRLEIIKKTGDISIGDKAVLKPGGAASKEEDPEKPNTRRRKK